MVQRDLSFELEAASAVVPVASASLLHQLVHLLPGATLSAERQAKLPRVNYKLADNWPVSQKLVWCVKSKKMKATFPIMLTSFIVVV